MEIEASIPSDRESVNGLVDHLFRHQAGMVTATLTRIFGIENLDLVEDSVQDSLVKALQRWPFHGVPQNPGGWILRTARNRVLDVLRRKSNFRSKENEIAHFNQVRFQDSEDFSPDPVLADSELLLIFTCCHPALSQEVQVALTLKTLCGFSVSEIARSFLTNEPTIAQRLVRAKRKIKEENIPYEVPAASELKSRMEAVLSVLYLLFNEGYSAHEGEDLIRKDLCDEAIRLTSHLVSTTIGNIPAVHALLALMLLQASRLTARMDDHGNLLLLAEQNRASWNSEMIHLGLHHLDLSSEGEELTRYHLEAGIAACHAIAPSYGSTDWVRICRQYDDLLQLNPSPVIALNRAIALSMVHGPDAGIRELSAIKDLPAMRSYYLFHSTLADFHVQKGEMSIALNYYRQAIELAGTEPEKRFLLTRVQDCEKHA